MDEVQTKITLDSLRAKGYTPHVKSGAVYLYQRGIIIIEIIPFLNQINLREESESGGYPKLVKSNIKLFEDIYD